MNLLDTTKVLTLVSAYDNRDFDDLKVAAWATALSGLDFEDCIAAVHLHYRRSALWLMPSMVRETVRSVIRQRQDAAREATYRRAIEEADPKSAAEHVDAIRAALKTAFTLPDVKSPHPPPPPLSVERQARTVPCAWCLVPAGEACINRVTGRRSGVTHDVRLHTVPA